ncbi:MAG: mandelate racemase [Planctomycetes bacterium]|nr:mandelate racemase [Planctomycetota bacterium]
MSHETSPPGGGRDPIRIERVEATPLLHPPQGYFKFFDGPPGRPCGRAAVLVKITANEGTAGWGESVPVPTWSDETHESVVTALRRYLAPVLIGRDPRDIEGAHEVMNRVIRPAFSTGMPMAKAGVDLALHDLAGKLAGLPAAELWERRAGGELTLSWTLNPRDRDEIDELIDEGFRRGYRNFNVKVAPDPAFDIDLCRRVKERAPDGFLWADANGGYDLATALEAAPRLADAGVAVLEQPIPIGRISGYRELKRQGALPIIIDEGVVSPDDLVEFHRLGMCDGVAMKPPRCGGLLPARRQVEYLRREGLIFLGSGLSDPDVSLAASLILYAAYGLDRPAALNGPQFLRGSVLRSPFSVIEGRIAVPDGPGLGVDVDESKIAELTIDLGAI